MQFCPFTEKYHENAWGFLGYKHFKISMIQADDLFLNFQCSWLTLVGWLTPNVFFPFLSLNAVFCSLFWPV